MNNVVSNQLMQFIYKFLYFFSTSRPNTKIYFSIMAAFNFKFYLFLSFMITKARLFFLEWYLSLLRFCMVMLFWHASPFGYKPSKIDILSSTLYLTLLDRRKINDKMYKKIMNRLVARCIFFSLIISTFCIFPTKTNLQERRWISENSVFFFFISLFRQQLYSKKAIHFCYTTVNSILQKFLAIWCHFVIMKYDIKEVLHNIPVSLYV